MLYISLTIYSKTRRWQGCCKCSDRIASIKVNCQVISKYMNDLFSDIDEGHKRSLAICGDSSLNRSLSKYYEEFI